MKRTMFTIVAVVFAMGCASAQLEAQIDEQKNMLLAKSKEARSLKAEIKKRDKKVSELKSEMDVLEDKMLDLEAGASYLKDLEYMYEQLADEVDRLKSENEMLKSKLAGKAKYDKSFSELGEILESAEAVNEPEPEVENKTKVAAVPPYPTVGSVPPPMMPPMAGMGMPMGMPFAGSMMSASFQTFQPFPLSKMGYTYSPPPDNAFHVRLSAKWANDETYFLVTVDGQEIIFSKEPPRMMKVGGKATPKSLLPPGADGYIPVDNIGPYTVKVQGCLMNGAVCVPIKSCKPRKMKDVTNSNFLLYECD